MANAATTKQTVKCLECNGSGYLAHFSHYAQGVCFVCGGTGRVDVETAKAAGFYLDPAVTALQNKRQEWVRSCTAADLARCTFDQLYKIHGLAANMFSMNELSRKQWVMIKRALLAEID